MIIHAILILFRPHACDLSFMVNCRIVKRYKNNGAFWLIIFAKQINITRCVQVYYLQFFFQCIQELKSYLLCWCLPSNQIASIKNLKDCFNININSLLFCSVCILCLQPVLFTYILIFSKNSCELNSTLLLNKLNIFYRLFWVYNLHRGACNPL